MRDCMAPHHGGFWNLVADFNINIAGFRIAGLFAIVWAVALAYWRFGDCRSPTDLQCGRVELVG
jgi:high-affinity nickel permease